MDCENPQVSPSSNHAHKCLLYPDVMSWAPSLRFSQGCETCKVFLNFVLIPTCSVLRNSLSCISIHVIDGIHGIRHSSTFWSSRGQVIERLVTAQKEVLCNERLLSRATAACCERPHKIPKSKRARVEVSILDFWPFRAIDRFWCILILSLHCRIKPINLIYG